MKLMLYTEMWMGAKFMKRQSLVHLSVSAATAVVLECAALGCAETPAKGGTQLEEVVVTAERREANLQETPIWVTAITSGVIAASGIKRVEDFAPMLPNVFVDDRNLRTQAIAIRGISADLNNPGLDQGVGIFIDGVYLGRATTANANLFDLDRVEVLRGPQCTLYAKNTIAGSINYITRKPRD